MQLTLKNLVALDHNTTNEFNVGNNVIIQVFKAFDEYLVSDIDNGKTVYQFCTYCPVHLIKEVNTWT